MKSPTIPEFPTHVVHVLINLTHEGQSEFTLAFMHEGAFFHYESGYPLIEYAGDKVLMAWELKPELAMRTPVDGIEGTDTVKFCYQCDAQVTYLFADARCAKCTRVETEG